MTFKMTRLGRKLEQWREKRMIRLATMGLDDHLRRDVGLPVRGEDRLPSVSLLFSIYR